MGETVRRYTAAVDNLVDRLDSLAPAAPEYAEAITATVVSPEAQVMLARAGVDTANLVDRAVAAASRFKPRAAATAGSPAHEVEILLRQQIDLAWWADADDFDTDTDLVSSPFMVDLRRLRKKNELRFRFLLASDRLGPRAYKYAIRTWFPSHAPGTPGLSSPYARPQMVALLNRIADEFARRAGAEAPPLWINCITRTVVDQCQLLELGFSAHYPSAHCRGWAADLEVGWYERFGLDGVLTGILTEWAQEGKISAIDEDRIWHVCPHPSFVEEL